MPRRDRVLWDLLLFSAVFLVAHRMGRGSWDASPERTYAFFSDHRFLPALLFVALLLRAATGAYRAATTAPGIDRPADPGREIWFFLAVATWKCFYPIGRDLEIVEVPLENHRLSTTLGLLALAAAPAALLPHRARIFALGTASYALSALALVVSLYARYFQFPPSITAVSAAGQIPLVTHEIAELLRAEDLLLAADLPLWFFFFFRSPPRPRAPTAALFLVGAAAVLLVPSALLARQLARTRYHAVALRGPAVTVSATGLLGHYLLDLHANLQREEKVSAAAAAEVRNYFQGRAVAPSPWTGAARGKNVVLIHGEAFHAFLLGLRWNGAEITPNLNRLAAGALLHAEGFDIARSGASSDAMFALQNALLPLPRHPLTLRFQTNRFRALPEILGDAGYATWTGSPASPFVWNLDAIHARYGWKTRRYRGFWKDGENIGGWGLADAPFLDQAYEEIARLPEPFLAYALPISGHYPYRIPDRHRVLDLAPLEGTRVADYLHTAHYFDSAVGSFLRRLEADGRSERTVIVFYGDHLASLPRADASVRAALPIDAADGLAIARFNRVPIVIRVPGAASKIPAPRAASLIDLTPTLLSLLGIAREGRFQLGRDLTSAEPPFLALPEGGGSDGEVFWIPPGTARLAPGCFDYGTGRPLPEGACAEVASEAARRARISRAVVFGDLFP